MPANAGEVGTSQKFEPHEKLDGMLDINFRHVDDDDDDDDDKDGDDDKDDDVEDVEDDGNDSDGGGGCGRYGLLTFTTLLITCGRSLHLLIFLLHWFLLQIRDWLTVEEEMLRQQAVVVGDIDEIMHLLDKQKNVLRELEQKKPQLDELVHTAENLRADTNRQQLHGKGALSSAPVSPPQPATAMGAVVAVVLLSARVLPSPAGL
ncbi:Dystrophin, isoforms A/C/F/G [Harpegnathos saltator]|uniref:Dystrophin, isoforms A/C/F/G n=1 Tax=Harpegnathos saltator TaxID=610380 RepID=E2B8E3_HARSA|nr:Dystrophin, isoforms A/C/F/G [Harpegnathos saltator]